ncbi:hypothetical protein [Vibrio proteolyticus]|uniref:D-glucuronyl C5-epimerase C-terminal domain-containing protein n=1 Tax=Vibrio proteolyticus NBRC 13287 TaxID=1219065 RepID=U2ZZQ3_VIBPR|nr:hypothetical protein [Vibrio proteolyticus]GAD66582.1 hypothetical protein VPR01S_04_01870 [Vibrio proteolyticus NBRC 13287]
MKVSIILSTTLFTTFALANDDYFCPNVISAPCQKIKPFVPTPEQLKNTANVYDTGQQNFDFSMYGNDQKTILKDNVPYANYWQLKDPNKYVFHPMVFGRYVFNNVGNPEFRNKLYNITNYAGVDLPNGGTGFYYPNHYPLNRMKGPDIIYSSISQSEILAGYLKNYLIEQSPKSKDLLLKVKKALFLHHSEGGVDLGIAQLELPLFHSNPEIILNGWLHAILHLNDYALVMNDKEISDYIHKNLNFFVKYHDVWYDSKRNITRYSDTSPHRVQLYKTYKDQEFDVIFESKIKELSNYHVKPIYDIARKYGAYDTTMTSVKDNVNTMMLNCSGFYNTYVTSSQPFSMKVKEGGYSPVRATPDGTGFWKTIESYKKNEIFIAKLDIDDGELICGYPTNFSKANKKNFYHMQHIVALLYIASYSSYHDAKLDKELIRIALEWLDNNKKFDEKNMEFEDPQKVLDSINRGKVLLPFTNFEQLKKIGEKKLND